MRSNVGIICKECSDERYKKFQSQNVGRKLNIGEFVKIPIKQETETEHLWFEVTEIIGIDKYKGKCSNLPMLITIIQENSIIEFEFKDIEQIYPE
jgi:hypothetical protein